MGGGAIDNEYQVSSGILDFQQNFWQNGNSEIDINNAYDGLMFRIDPRVSLVNQPFQFWMRSGTTYYPLSNINSSGAYITTSDEKLKNNIQPIKQDKSLERIKNINICSYFYNHQDEKTSKKNIGIIAQQIQNVNPHAVHIHTNLDNTTNLSISYNDIFLHNINATKEIIRRLEIIENSLTIPDQQPILVNQNGYINEKIIIDEPNAINNINNDKIIYLEQKLLEAEEKINSLTDSLTKVINYINKKKIII